jgi:GT2 family glycosyltransferase
MLDLSIAIVNTNTRDLLANCLRSLYENTQKISFEVFVVDNNSQDGSVEMVREKFPQVRLIANKSNRGFSGATNQALKEAEGKCSLLLNPDTLILEGAIEKMVQFMEKHPEAGALGCKLLNPDRTLQPSCKSFPNFLNLFFESLSLDKLFPKSRLFGRYYMSYWDHNDVREVDQPMGSCLMVRKEVIDKVGLIDEQFFCFFDEVDWCYRIKKEGFKIFFTPEARIIHYRGQTFKRMPLRSFWYWHRSLLRYYRKHYPGIPSFLIGLYVISMISLKFLIIIGLVTGIYFLIVKSVIIK